MPKIGRKGSGMKIIKQTGTANTTYAPGRTILYLAIHYTAGVSSKPGSASGCASWFANPNAGGSADYIVDEETLIQYNPDPYNRYCHAVGGGRYNTQGGRLYGVAKNSNCISLEICSTNSKGKITVPNDTAYSFTEKVLEKAIEATKQLMEMYHIDAEHVIRHYDCNGKPCPGIIGWNKDSGSESAWEAFHKAIGGKPIEWYRVGVDWQDGKCIGQIEADEKLENAKATADRYGYKVFDSKGVLVYVAKSITEAGHTQAKTINALPDEKSKASAMLELVYKTDKSGILPSVSTAQMILESGYCGTDLALNANNCFGMKENLSGNTWQSVWDGKSVYRKKTQEDDGHGNLYWITAPFRKYPCVEDSIRDHSAYLLGAMNGAKPRYAGLTSAKNYREAITIIKNGGYATDTKYISKICSIIERFGLDKYDGETKPTAPVQPAEPVKYYRVRKSWSDKNSQIGAFTVLENAILCVGQNPGYAVFDEDGKKVYPADSAFTPYLVRVTIDDLNFRRGPGTHYISNGFIEPGIYTIIDEENGWGLLKAYGAKKDGWVCLKYTMRM